MICQLSIFLPSHLGGLGERLVDVPEDVIQRLDAHRTRIMSGVTPALS